MLNGTFLVQAIHFFIAYLIVERLLFRPIVSEIQREQLKNQHLKEAVRVQAHRVNDLEQARHAAWDAASKEFATIMPQMHAAHGGISAQELPVVPVLDRQLKAKIIDECVETLLKEVNHVH